MGNCQQGAYDEYLLCRENECGGIPIDQTCIDEACLYSCESDYNYDWAACATAAGCDSYAANHECVAVCQKTAAACAAVRDPCGFCSSALGRCLKTCPVP